MSRDGDGHALRDLKPQGMSPPPRIICSICLHRAGPRVIQNAAAAVPVCVYKFKQIYVLFFQCPNFVSVLCRPPLRSAGRPDGWSKMSITFWQLCLYMVCERRFAVMRTATSCGPYGHTEGGWKGGIICLFFVIFFEINISENIAGYT